MEGPIFPSRPISTIVPAGEDFTVKSPFPAVRDRLALMVSLDKMTAAELFMLGGVGKISFVRIPRTKFAVCVEFEMLQYPVCMCARWSICTCRAAIAFRVCDLRPLVHTLIHLPYARTNSYRRTAVSMHRLWTRLHAAVECHEASRVA